MLVELDIRDFAIADHVRLECSPGLNVLTGETGAGKSIIVDALALLLGGRADPDVVRHGAKAARIEGVFRLDSAELERTGLASVLAEYGVELDEDTLIISREVPREGRSVARVNGRAVVQAALTTIGQHLVDIHGQADYLSLLRPAEHVNFLDRYADLWGLRTRLAAQVGELRRLRNEIERIQQNERERARRQDRLAYEIHEIRAARLQPGEEEALRDERRLLANAEELATLANSAFEALAGGEGSRRTSALDALGEVSLLLAQLTRIDPRLAAEAELAAGLEAQAQDLARNLRLYRDTLEFNPARLEQIEERLALIGALKRKYGDSVEEVLAYAARAEAELAALAGSEERLAALQDGHACLHREVSALAAELSEQRRQAAIRLAAAIEAELRDLRLEHGRFAVQFTRTPDPEGAKAAAPLQEIVGSDGGEQNGWADALALDRSGVERVDFLVSLNPGEPLRPLAKVASGGETARLMLALKTVLGATDAVPTLVFDEVDVGIGGRSGQVVGRKLAALAQHHQVLCITHLPQVAAFGDTHFAVSKYVEGERIRTVVRELDRQGRIEELALMLGGSSRANRTSAEELLDAARQLRAATAIR